MGGLRYHHYKVNAFYRNAYCYALVFVFLPNLTLLHLHLTSVSTASASALQAIYPTKTRHPLPYYQARGEKID